MSFQEDRQNPYENLTIKAGLKEYKELKVHIIAIGIT